MTTTATALIYLVMWSVALTVLLIGVRGAAVSRGEKALNAFQADGRDLGGFGLRVTRAHANSLENLACAAALMLLAIATGHAEVTNGLAMVLVACRVGQSVVHIASGAMGAVLVRATLFTAQVVIWVMWGWKLCGAE